MNRNTQTIRINPANERNEICLISSRYLAGRKQFIYENGHKYYSYADV